MTEKDKKIIEHAEKTGTPIFVLTAKDICSTQAMAAYLTSCISNLCEMNHLEGIVNRIKEFQEWQAANPDKCKIPD